MYLKELKYVKLCGTCELFVSNTERQGTEETFHNIRMPTIIVTGASRGIGLATVNALLASSTNTNVIGISRSALSSLPDVQTVASTYPERFTYISGNLSSDETQFSAIAATNGKLDTIIFNAGVVEPIAKLASVDINEYKNLMDVNVTSILGLAQKSIPLLRESAQGRMLFVSSGASTGPVSGWGAYCMSKAALNMMSSVFAVEEPEIVSFALRPGVVETEMQATIRKDVNVSEMGESNHEKFKQLYNSGELLKPAVPGGILAKMALEAGKEFSGLYLSWNDAKLEQFSG